MDISKIHEEICTYQVCKLAKEKGFQLDCIGYYDFVGEFHFNYESAISNKERTFCHNKYNNIWHRDLTDAPTQSLLQRWLREEKRIEVNAFWDNCDNMWLGYAQEMDAPDLVGSFPLNKPFPTYELALEDALKYVLENLV